MCYIFTCIYIYAVCVCGFIFNAFFIMVIVNMFYEHLLSRFKVYVLNFKLKSLISKFK